MREGAASRYHSWSGKLGSWQSFLSIYFRPASRFIKSSLVWSTANIEIFYPYPKKNRLISEAVSLLF